MCLLYMPLSVLYIYIIHVFGVLEMHFLIYV